jgi:hypothetical protein
MRLAWKVDDFLQRLLCRAISCAEERTVSRDSVCAQSISRNHIHYSDDIERTIRSRGPFFFFFSFFSFPFSFLLPSLREMEKGLAAERGCRLKKHFLVRVLSEILVQDENEPSQLKASWIIRFWHLALSWRERYIYVVSLVAKNPPP